MPFAGLKQSYENLVGYDAYEKKIQAIFSEIGYEVNSVHRVSDVLMNADAVLVGGGNTFNLLKQCQDRNLMEPIKDRVLNDNIPYIGLREGMMFRIEDDRVKHEGVSDKMCRIFKYGQSPLELGSNDEFSYLLK